MQSKTSLEICNRGNSKDRERWKEHLEEILNKLIPEVPVTDLECDLVTVAWRLGGMDGQCPWASKLKGPPRERGKRK